MLLVRLCDRDRDRHLNISELRQLATRSCGTTFTRRGWHVEYAKLAAEFHFHPDRGMPLRTAVAMLHDTTGAGAYMSDDQLVKAVRQAQQDHRQERGLHVDEQQAPAKDYECSVIIWHSVAFLDWCSKQHGQGGAHRSDSSPAQDGVVHRHRAQLSFH